MRSKFRGPRLCTAKHAWSRCVPTNTDLSLYRLLSTESLPTTAEYTFVLSDHKSNTKRDLKFNKFKS